MRIWLCSDIPYVTGLCRTTDLIAFILRHRLKHHCGQCQWAALRLREYVFIVLQSATNLCKLSRSETITMVRPCPCIAFPAVIYVFWACRWKAKPSPSLCLCMQVRNKSLQDKHRKLEKPCEKPCRLQINRLRWPCPPWVTNAAPHECKMGRQKIQAVPNHKTY